MTDDDAKELLGTVQECLHWARHGLTGYPTFSFSALNAIKDQCELTLEYLEDSE